MVCGLMPQLRLCITVGDPGQIRRQIALEPLLRHWSAVAKKTKAHLPIGHDGASPGRIAWRPREGHRNAIVHNLRNALRPCPTDSQQKDRQCNAHAAHGFSRRFRG